MSNSYPVGPAVDLAQRQTPIPLGNQQHCYVHAATGELNAIASPKPSPVHQRQLSLGVASPGLYQASLPPVSNHATVGPGSASQPASQWLTSTGGAACAEKRTLDVSECRAVLGETSFSLLRSAMLAQQDLFLEQLWELHRLARVQGRKALRPDMDVTSDAMTAESRNFGSTIFCRERQAAVRAETMSAIFSLPTVPESLRRGRQARAASVPGLQGGPVSVPGGLGLAAPRAMGGVPAMANVPATANEGIQASSLTGPSPAAAVSGLGLLSQDPTNVHLPNMPGIGSGSLQSLCNLHNLHAPTSTSTPGTNMASAHVGPQQSLLDLMMPGLSSSLDPHMQWMQKNGADRSKMSMPLGHTPLMRETFETGTAGPSVSMAQSLGGTGAPSASVWSGQSMVVMPNASSSQLQNSFGVKDAPHKWPTFNPLGPHPPPPTVGLFSGPALPADSLLGSAAPSSGLAPSGTTMPADTVVPTLLPDATGKYTDTSAASILLSLKGEASQVRTNA